MDSSKSPTCQLLPHFNRPIRLSIRRTPSNRCTTNGKHSRCQQSRGYHALAGGQPDSGGWRVIYGKPRQDWGCQDRAGTSRHFQSKASEKARDRGLECLWHSKRSVTSGSGRVLWPPCLIFRTSIAAVTSLQCDSNLCFRFFSFFFFLVLGKEEMLSQQCSDCRAL